MPFFKLIGNTLGTYLEADLSFLESGVCCLGRVLVLLDLRKGLASEIDIKFHDIVYSQCLDYVGIPFKCNRCHKYGHLASHCILTSNRHSRDGIKSYWKKKEIVKLVLSVDKEFKSRPVSPRVEGLDTCSTRNFDPWNFCFQSLNDLGLFEAEGLQSHPVFYVDHEEYNTVSPRVEVLDSSSSDFLDPLQTQTHYPFSLLD